MDGADQRKNGDMDGYVGFHAALRRSYYNFIHGLSKQCKELVRHHLDSVTSPYSQVCYEYDLLGFAGSGTNSVHRGNQLPTTKFFLDLSEGGTCRDENLDVDQENIPPKDQQHTTPGKGTDPKEALRESQLTVPETPSPDQPSDLSFGFKKKENVMDMGARKRHARSISNGRNSDISRNQNGGFLFGAGDLCSKSVSSYSDICSISAQHFARIREVLIERNVPSALNSGFLTPW